MKKFVHFRGLFAAIGVLSLILAFQNCTQRMNANSLTGLNNTSTSINTPTLLIFWSPNRETAVNTAGGGYKVYYGNSSTFNPAASTMVSVPYVSGTTAPTNVTINKPPSGTYYVFVVAYSALNAPGASGGSMSQPSTSFMFSVP